MALEDLLAVLGTPPLAGVYWGSIVLLVAIAEPVDSALRRAEVAAAFATAAMVPPAVLTALLLCLYA